MLDEARRKRARSAGALQTRRGKELTAPFYQRISTFQIRAAFLRGRLASNRSEEERQAMFQDMDRLIEDVDATALAFEESVKADLANPRVLEVRKALERLAEQLHGIWREPVFPDPLSFHNPARLTGRAS